MTRSTGLSIFLAAFNLGAFPVAAQVAPPQVAPPQIVPTSWNHRTMTGASIEVMTFEGEGLPMVALRSTRIGDRLVVPDFTLAAGYLSGAVVAALDLGFGTSFGRNVLFTISGGPTLLAAVSAGSGGGGAGAVPGLHARAGVILPVAANLGFRFDAGRRFFFGGGETYGVWVIGFGVTGLGSPRRAPQP